MEAVITLKNVSKRFSGFEVKDLSFEVKKALLQALSVPMVWGNQQRLSLLWIS